MIGNRAFIFVALLVLISSCTTYQIDAATYKWTDKNGQVNYTQAPPSQSAYTTLAEPAPTRIVSTPPLVNQREAEKTSAHQDMTAIYEHNCKEATTLLNSLEQAGDKQVAMLDSQGQKKYLTPEERLSYTEKAKQDMSKYCAN
jgi:hypothetical protein